jgi:wyosine [tRNA(Phe)-imidazoG37] synthetase (radical SAM superfamily)
MNCLYCGKPIPEPFRPTRKYCNTSHRVGAYKKRLQNKPPAAEIYQFEKALVGKYAKQENRYAVLLINNQRYRMPEDVIDYLMRLRRQEISTG